MTLEHLWAVLTSECTSLVIHTLIYCWFIFAVISVAQCCESACIVYTNTRRPEDILVRLSGHHARLGKHGGLNSSWVLVSGLIMPKEGASHVSVSHSALVILLGQWEWDMPRENTQVWTPRSSVTAFFNIFYMYIFLCVWLYTSVVPTASIHQSLITQWLYQNCIETATSAVLTCFFTHKWMCDFRFFRLQ